MKLVAQRFQLAREINPQIGLLGAVLFGTGTSSTAIHAEVRADIAEAFGGASPLFASTIRHSERTGRDSRKKGLLAHELETEAVQDKKEFFAAMRRGEKTPRVSKTAASVAFDYRNLAVEILTVLQQAEAAAE
jgi:hypothetical protein